MSSNEKAFSSHPGHGNSQKIAAQAAREVAGNTAGLAADMRGPQAQSDQGAAASGRHTEVPANASNRAYGRAK